MGIEITRANNFLVTRKPTPNAGLKIGFFGENFVGENPEMAFGQFGSRAGGNFDRGEHGVHYTLRETKGLAVVIPEKTEFVIPECRNRGSTTTGKKWIPDRGIRE